MLNLSQCVCQIFFLFLKINLSVLETVSQVAYGKSILELMNLYQTVGALSLEELDHLSLLEGVHMIGSQEDAASLQLYVVNILAESNIKQLPWKKKVFMCKLLPL